MDQSLEILIIKRDWKKYFHSQRALWIVLTFVEILFLGAMCLSLYIRDELSLSLWLSGIGIGVFMLVLGMFLLPGQGDIILSSEGLKINWFFRLWPFCRWDNIIGFYLISEPKYEKLPNVIICEMQNQGSRRSFRRIVPSCYNASPEALCELFNEWKTRHAANPECVKVDESRHKVLPKLSGLDATLSALDSSFFVDFIRLIYHVIVGVLKFLMHH